jgi:hypothetical protein
MALSRSSLPGLLVKGILAGIVYVFGAVLAGMLAAAFHVSLPNFIPAGVDQQTAFLYFPLTCALMGLGLVPLALHTAGSRVLRGTALFLLLFVSLGVNAVIEMKIFLTVFAHGGALVMVASIFPPAFLCGFALAFLVKAEPAEASAFQQIRCFFAARTIGSWSWRFLLAVLVFPVFYFLFGMMVAPIVVPYYRAGLLGLTLPPMTTILPVVLLRSALFLLASLPFLVFWKSTRGSLVLWLGLAHWVLVGLFGLVQVFWWPAAMRIAHSLEIGADSFAYAAALVILLVPRERTNPVTASAQAAPMFPS